MQISNTQMKVALGVVVVLAVAMGIFGVTRMTKTAHTDAGINKIGGDPTGMIICDDKFRISIYATDAKGEPVIRTIDEYQAEVPGHGKGYREFKGAKSGKTWAFGKNGQVTSPYPEDLQ